MSKLVPVEIIANKIAELRGKKIMLDKDLAALYGVTTFNLNKAVKRNLKRFPPDFILWQFDGPESIRGQNYCQVYWADNSLRSNSPRMFRLTPAEFKSLIFQIGISKKGRGGTRYCPYAFTEQDVAMLSGVIRNSHRATELTEKNKYGTMTASVSSVPQWQGN